MKLLKSLLLLALGVVAFGCGSGSSSTSTSTPKDGPPPMKQPDIGGKPTPPPGAPTNVR